MVKSYAAMGGLHGAIDAAPAIRDHRLDPQRIRRIRLTVGETVYKHGWWPPDRPLTPIGAQMNIGYVTRRAHFSTATCCPSSSHPRALDADDVWTLLGRTEVDLDESLAHAPVIERFRTDLHITMDDGAAHHARVDVPHGAPTDPVTNEELVAKFHALADRVTGTRPGARDRARGPRARRAQRPRRPRRPAGRAGIGRHWTDRTAR